MHIGHPAFSEFFLQSPAGEVQPRSIEIGAALIDV
jgi:hypothetical protein